MRKFSGIIWAAGLAVFFHLMDCATTVFGIAFCQLQESNPLFRSQNGHLALGVALSIKFLFLVFGPGILSYGIYKSTRSQLWASLPWLWAAYQATSPVVSNVANIYMYYRNI